MTEFDADSVTPPAAAVMGADLAGLTAGGVAGGTAGFGYADLGTNGITLVADLAEQNMAQVRLVIIYSQSNCSRNLGNQRHHWQRAHHGHGQGTIFALHGLSSLLK